MKQPRLVISLPIVDGGEQLDGTWSYKVQTGPAHFASVAGCASEEEAIVRLLGMEVVARRAYVRMRSY